MSDEKTSTNFALTPRILSGMLVGGNVLGTNWAVKLANISDGEVPDKALKPVINHSLADNGGDDILAALLPASILMELTADESAIDHIRDGIWSKDLLDHITEMLGSNDGAACEEIYARCSKLMADADTVAFHWSANYIMHILTIDNLDDPSMRKLTKLYGEFADTDAVGGLFVLFMMSFVGPNNFENAVKNII